MDNDENTNIFRKFFKRIIRSNEERQEENIYEPKKNIYVDAYFEDAGRLVCEKRKASTGIIQRFTKVGINRAFKILGQLEYYKVIGPEDGIKPQEVLMTSEEFEHFLKTVIINDEKSVDRKTSNPQDSNGSDIQARWNSHLNSLKRLDIEPEYSYENELSSNLENVLIQNSNEVQVSKFLNNLIKYNRMERLKIILFDGSQVSFSEYNGVGNLLLPVITDAQKMLGALSWLNKEMQERTQKFLSVNVKNIDEYDRKISPKELKIIVVVDEIYYLQEMSNDFIIKLLLNSSRFGIYFVFFTKFNLRSLSLGIKKDLLLMQDFSYLENLFPHSVRNTINKNFDSMSGHDFEQFCADLLRSNGYKNVEVTQGSGDHGVDILAEKEDISFAIQCKCYSSNIGNSAVQQAHTGKSIYKKDIAVVITNRYFTEQAKQEADTLGVKLWDREKLLELMRRSEECPSQ